MPHPDLDPVGGQVSRQTGEGAQRIVAQDGCPPPIRRRVETGQLDLTSDAHAAAGHCDHHLTVAGHDGMAWARARRRDHRMIAALGLKADPVARRRRQAARACPGGNHRRVADHLVPRRRYGCQPARLDTEPSRPSPHPLGPKRYRVADQRRDISSRVGAVATGLHQSAEGVAAVELRLLLAQLVLVQLEPFHPIVPAQPPCQSIGFEIGAAGKNIEQATPLNELSNPGRLGKTAVPVGRVRHQRTQRAGDGLHPRHRRPGPQKPHQPGHQPRQVAPSDRQRP